VKTRHGKIKIKVSTTYLISSLVSFAYVEVDTKIDLTKEEIEVSTEFNRFRKKDSTAPLEIMIVDFRFL
jgi:hypothetical protein